MTAAGWVRRLVLAVCAISIAGMIASSVADRTGAALTFGLLTAVAILCSMVATAVAADQRAPAPSSRLAAEEAQAARVEELIGLVVAAGADEGAVRELVREAMRLGRATRAPGG